MLIKFTPQLTNAGKRNLLLILAASLFTILYGCSFNNYSRAELPQSKNISGIRVGQDDRAWNCIIKSNYSLKFSAINHISPKGIVLYFPDTTLHMPPLEPISSANEIIGFIEADEYVTGNIKNSRILIGLNIDRPYHISPEDSGLKISFPKTLNLPPENAAMEISADMDIVVAPERDVPSASVLTSVTTTPLKDYIIVYLNSDAAILDYESFVIDKPARIVFDIYNIKSPVTGIRTIVVDSRWVKQVRYNPYPDKLRLVLDTDSRFLSQYFSFPISSGLLIYVGRMPEPLTTN